jgi:hypothetical protein
MYVIAGEIKILFFHEELRIYRHSLQQTKSICFVLLSHAVKLSVFKIVIVCVSLSFLLFKKIRISRKIFTFLIVFSGIITKICDILF